MADIKISNLPAATAAARTDEFESNQSGTSRKLTGAQLASLAPLGYIEGLRMEWVSGTSLRVTTGAAVIESLGRLVEVATAITKSSLSLTANTWYHIYLYVSGSAADIEIVTTAPAAAYSGSARSKSGDTSRRYLGSVRTTTGGALIQFQHNNVNNIVTYLGGEYSLRNLLSAGLATTATNISAANIVPVTATSIDILMTNAATAGVAVTGNSEQSLPLAAGAGNSYFGYAGASSGTGVPNHPIDSLQRIQYRFLSAPTGSGLYIDLQAYAYTR